MITGHPMEEVAERARGLSSNVGNVCAGMARLHWLSSCSLCYVRAVRLAMHALHSTKPGSKTRFCPKCLRSRNTNHLPKVNSKMLAESGKVTGQMPDSQGSIDLENYLGPSQLV